MKKSESKLFETHPELCQEWDFEKNNIIAKEQNVKFEFIQRSLTKSEMELVVKNIIKV